MPGPVFLERRGAARTAAPAAPALQAPLELRSSVSPPEAARRPAPAGVEAAGALVERAVALVRRAGASIQRAPDAASLLAEGAGHEAAGRLPAAFRAYASALLASPLDAGPVRPLERLATTLGCRIALAQLYERVLEKVPEHPSAETLAARAVHLRQLAVECRGEPEVPAAPGRQETTGAGNAQAMVGRPGGDPRPQHATPRPGDPLAPIPLPGGASPQQETPRPGDPQAPIPLPGGAAPQPETPRPGDPRAPIPLPGSSVALQGTPRSGDRKAPIPLPGHATSSAGAPAGEALHQPSPSPVPHQGSAVFSGGAPADESIHRPSPRTVPLGTRWLADRDVPAHARLIAWAVDGAILGIVPLASVAAGLSAFDGSLGLSGADRLLHLLVHGGALPTAAFALALVTAFVYLTLGAALGGRTLGARVAGLRAVDRTSGNPPDVGTAALRSVLAIAGTLAFLVGPLWAFVDPRGQSLHDRVAGTRTLHARSAR